MNKAPNSVLAKCRSMYGKRITREQYEELLSLKTVSEIASYLKSKTPYAADFSSSDSDYTAKRLRDIIEHHRFSLTAKLCKLEKAIGERFYEYFITKSEIEQILKCTMFILGGSKDRYMLELSGSMDSQLKIDLFALGKANSLEEILAALKKTKYEKLYASCLSMEEVSYLNFETAFYAFLMDFQNSLLLKAFKGEEREEVFKAIGVRNDMRYIENRIRAFTFYKDIPGVKTAFIPSKVTNLREKELSLISKSLSLSEMNEALRKSVYKSFCPLEEGRIEAKTEKFLYDYYKKKIRFSVYPSAVMYSFVYLSKIEAANLIKIVEGKKYGLDSEEIKRELLI